MLAVIVGGLALLCLGCPDAAHAGLFGRGTFARSISTQPLWPSLNQQAVDGARYGRSLHAGGNGYRYNRPREERVMELPEDGDYWHFTLISNGNAESQMVERFLSEAPRLNSLANQTKYHKFTPTHPYAATYFARDPKPLAILQTSDGKAIWKASAGNFPKHAEQMADEIESAIWAHVEDCGPDCTPDESTPESKVPDLRPKDKPGLSADFNDLIVLGLGALVVIALIVALMQRQR